jgi:hypothetical protein
MAARACDTPDSAALLPRHGRPATFLYIRRLLPGVGLLQRRQVVGGGGAALELVDAARRDRRDHGAARGVSAKADDDSREGAHGYALERRVKDSPRYHKEFCMTFPPNLGDLNAANAGFARRRLDNSA